MKRSNVMKTTSRIAAAVAAAALALPALGSDPTQPEVANPAPAVVLRGSGRAEARALNADPTWPGTEVAAPATPVRPVGEALAGGIANDEPLASAVRAEKPAAVRVSAK